MRACVIGLVFLLSAQSAFSQSVAAPRPDHFDWGRVSSAFRNYVDDPSGANADAVRALLPSGRAAATGVAPPYDTLMDWLAMLEHQVRARDRAATQLAFALDHTPAMGSGEASESLDMMLGELLRTDPRLFLSALKAEEGRTGVRSPLGGLVGNLGPEFVDRSQAQCGELRRRIQSVQGVGDGALAEVKTRVLTSLNAAAKGVCTN